MAKTKFFRVAVEGATVDGREITRDMIQQMADSYNTATYAARINCEHLRGYSPEGPFNAWGTVDAVKAEQIDLAIGGKTEKRLALFAQLDVTEQAKSYNEDGQKLYSSVEVHPDFAKTGKAYLIGLAFTDSPASLGTEVLKFSRDDKRKGNLLQVEDEPITLSFEAGTPASDITAGVFAGLKSFFADFGKAPPAQVEQQQPAPPPITPPAGTGSGDHSANANAQIAAFVGQFGEQMTKLTEGIQKSFAAQDTRLAKLAEDFTALEARIEKTPASGYTARQPASGGNGRARAEC